MSIDISVKKRSTQTTAQPNKKRMWLWQVFGLVVFGTLTLVGALFLSKKTLSGEHLVSSTPKANEVYAAPPMNVTIAFDQNLIASSSMKVAQNGAEVTQGDARVVDSTTLQKDLQSLLGDGTYEVFYNACFENTKCEAGSFHFRIDTALQKNYTDLREQQSVVLALENSKISQPNIIVSPGTDISWVNNDAQSVSVSTETRERPQYFSSMNSGELQQGEKFQLILILSGQYNYDADGNGEGAISGSIIVSP